MNVLGLALALLQAVAADPPPAPPGAPVEAAQPQAAKAADGDQPQRLALPGTPASLPAVTAQMYQLNGRFEVSPMLAVSIGDAFYRLLAAGVRAELHVSERWSFGGHGLFGTSIASAPVSVCSPGPCDSPSSSQLRSAPGNIDLLLGAEASWVPFYGKLSLAGEKTIHFDLYLAAGPELLRMHISPDAASAAQSSWQVGGRISLGQRFFLSDRLAIRIAASELVYGAHVRGVSEIERQLSVEGGVSWIFGGH